MKTHRKKLWIGLVILALLSPLGVILPERFRAGGAWGEWKPEELERLAGYIPGGLKRLAGLWKAPFPDYGGSAGASATVQTLSYIASAFIGILAVAAVIYLIAKVVMRNGK
jgi:cobalt/nickel transport protein